MIVAEQDSVIGPTDSGATARLRSRNPSPSVCAMSAPTGVGSEDLDRRSTSLAPYNRSSSRTCRLMAPWLTQSSRAALVMLPNLTVASNALRACRGSFALDTSRPPRSADQLAQGSTLTARHAV